MSQLEPPSSVANALEDTSVDVAVLTSIPSVGCAAGYWPSWEMWPGYNPYVPDPIVAVFGRDGAVQLLLPNYYAAYADAVSVEVVRYPTYSHRRRLDPTAELARAIATLVGTKVGRLGYEPHSLSEALRSAIASEVETREWVDVEARLELARVRKHPDEIERIQAACQVADLIQTTVKLQARPGMSEIELASEAIRTAWESVGARYAILLQIASGPETGSIPSGEPSARTIERGDIVCADTSPWLRGYWSDSCNGIVVGEPSPRHVDVFNVLAAALQQGIEAVRPGVEARTVDEACRSVVREAGYDYPHHTGHGLGTAHTEHPRVTPDSSDVLEEGMVIALEPGIYIPDWGGWRHEHVVLVTEKGCEALTRFQHSL